MADSHSSGTLPPLPPNENGVEYRHAFLMNGFCVGSDGSVWKYRGNSWRKRRAWLNTKGYPTAKAFGRKFVIHIVMLESFIGPRPTRMHVSRHLNDVKSDNRIENLLWGTQADNAEDMRRNGHGVDNRGESNGRSKLTESDVMEIRKLRENGDSISAIAARFNIANSTVSGITNRKIWRHLS